MVNFEVEPGILSAIAFVALEALAVGLLDFSVARWMSVYYYRLLSTGRAIEIKDANILALTRHQIGNRLDIHNCLASGFKLFVLAAIFYINVSIQSRALDGSPEPLRMASFSLLPNDEAWKRNVTYMVLRAFDDSRACYSQDGDVIFFYRIAFNLTDGVVLQSDLGPPSNNTTYSVNRSSVICTKPSVVSSPIPLAKVVGCTRNTSNHCLDTIDMEKKIDLGAIDFWAGSFSKRGYTFNVTTFEDDEVKRLFSEFDTGRGEKLLFTCVNTFIGAITSSQVRPNPCLLVYRTRNFTFIERWNLVRKDDLSLGLFLQMQYPGPIFDGDLAIEIFQSRDYLSRFDSMSEQDFHTVAADIVALSSEYNYSVNVYLPFERRVSFLPLTAVILAGIIFSLSFSAFILTLILLARDRRPRFNFVSGLATIAKKTYHRNTTENDPDAYFAISSNEDQRVFISSTPYPNISS